MRAIQPREWPTFSGSAQKRPLPYTSSEQATPQTIFYIGYLCPAFMGLQMQQVSQKKLSNDAPVQWTPRR